MDVLNNSLKARNEGLFKHLNIVSFKSNDSRLYVNIMKRNALRFNQRDNNIMQPVVKYNTPVLDIIQP